MKTDRCKLCHQNKVLIKAHSIPRNFFLLKRGKAKHWAEARRHDAKSFQFRQNGIIDKTILCKDCDHRFSPWDDYGFKLLGNPPGHNAFPEKDSELLPFTLRDVDYGQLKLFVLSVLWRASVSSAPFYSRIQLGKHEEAIADMIRKADPGSYDQ